MTIPSTGITAEVIRDFMPPYELSADLLEATFARLPPPPPDATPAQRQTRIARLIAEITACKPGDAGQARIAAQILILRETADTLAPGANTPHLTVQTISRQSRTMAELHRAATSMDRSLMQHQLKPVPFFGIVVEDAVDTATLDAIWCGNPRPPEPQPRESQHPEPMPNPPPPPRPAREPKPAPHDAALRPEPPPTEPQADRVPTEAPAQRDRSPASAASPDPHADATPEWSITKIDEGPGWSREVLRHRSSTGGNGTSPGSAT